MDHINKDIVKYDKMMKKYYFCRLNGTMSSNYKSIITLYKTSQKDAMYSEYYKTTKDYKTKFMENDEFYTLMIQNWIGLKYSLCYYIKKDKSKNKASDEPIGTLLNNINYKCNGMIQYIEINDVTVLKSKELQKYINPFLVCKKRFIKNFSMDTQNRDIHFSFI